jgi:hypothetical protein
MQVPFHTRELSPNQWRTVGTYRFLPRIDVGEAVQPGNIYLTSGVADITTAPWRSQLGESARRRLGDRRDNEPLDVGGISGCILRAQKT